MFAVTAGLDVDAVGTIGSHVDPAVIGPVRANVRVERFVPQADVLRRSAVVVSHGERAPSSACGGAAHRDAATLVADEIAAMPTATDLLDEIDAIADT